MENCITIGIEKYDEDICVHYDPDMTLESFKAVIEKAIGSPCKPSFSQYEKKKTQKMKDFAKNHNDIFLLNNDNLGSFIKQWKGNFKNEHNSCFKDSFIQSLVHSLIEQIVEKEEALRREKGLPTAKNFKDYKNNNPNLKEKDFYADLLELCDIIKEKIKNNDSEPILNSYDKSFKAKDQKYLTGEGYATNNIRAISRSSIRTSSGLKGGLLTLKLLFGLTETFVNDHEIFFKEKTVISDCLGVEIRNFQECGKCHFNNIGIFNIGSIVIPMYDYLITSGEKSFSGLLKYYYKINHFGNENLKCGEFCGLCKKYDLKYYNKISTLPDVLIIDFNLDKYYINATNSQLKEESFYWTLEEYISLIDHYEAINYYDSSKNHCYYELTSFIGHFGNKEYGHFINFSKVDDKWYLFDDLTKNSYEIGDFYKVKFFIENNIFAFSMGEGTKETIVESKLKICNCFYNRYKCKGYEKYVEEIKNKIKNLK